MEFPVDINRVWKSYGPCRAVRDLSLRVPSQSIYGFLGPNGAGKSTAIRMILGLQRPDRGSLLLFGQPLASHRSALLARIGSLVEAPSLYLHLTGRENLEVHRRLLDAPKTAVEKALETVDLLSSADRVTRAYSSGMKQRLGLAQALLGDPELLVLDEPTNGLDPAGIQEVRSLIQDLPRRLGVTLFLSSHLLSEVEQVATHLAIISAGVLKFEGTAEEMRLRTSSKIVADIDDRERTAAVLAGAGIAFTMNGNRVSILSQDEFGPAAINTMLVQAGVAVSQLISRHLTLEDTFLELTNSP